MEAGAMPWNIYNSHLQLWHMYQLSQPWFK